MRTKSNFELTSFSENTIAHYTLVNACRWCPESLRWLEVNGRIDEIKEVLKKASLVNKVTLPGKYAFYFFFLFIASRPASQPETGFHLLGHFLFFHLLKS